MLYPRDGGKISEAGFSRLLSKIFNQNGVISPSHMSVTQDGTPSDKVIVTVGDVLIGNNAPNASDYFYHGWIESSEKVTIGANVSGNPRIDAIVAYVDKTEINDTDNDNPEALKLVAVPGTAAGSPVAPDATAIAAAIGDGNPYVILATVAVASGFSSIVNANITDTRSFTNIDTDKIAKKFRAGWDLLASAGTRVSNTQMTVAGNITDRLWVGKPLELADNTTKYFYVTSFSYSAPNTIINFTGGTDYVLAGNPTNIYGGLHSSPVGFPDRFIYTATWTGYSAQPNNPIGFFIHGRKCTIFTTNENGGTSNSSNATVSLPVTANLAVGQSVFASISAQVNNSVSDESKGIIVIKQISPTVANLFRTYTDGSWTAGGTRTALFQMDYPI